jgi:hypothetical protein
MSRWNNKLDLRTIPDDVLLAESARRLRARQIRPPRAKVLRQCPKCREAFGVRDLRKHLPRCTAQKMDSQATSSRIIRKVTDIESQEAENYRYWQSIPVGERLAAVCEVTEAAYAIRKAKRNADERHERPARRVQPRRR